MTVSLKSRELDSVSLTRFDWRRRREDRSSGVSGMMLGFGLVTAALLLWPNVSATTNETGSSATTSTPRGVPMELVKTSYPSSLPAVCVTCNCQLRNTFWIINCSGAGFVLPIFSLPNTTIILDLSHNLFRFILRSTFRGMSELRVLDLSSNYIVFVRKGAFDSLEKLEYLSLENNAMFPLQVALPPGVFKNLRNLNTLWLSGNKGGDAPLPDDIFSDLISLRELYIDGFKNMKFGPGFQNLTDLQYITVSGRNRFIACDIQRLEEDAFTYVPNLKVLELMQCNITYIHPDAFASLKNLTVLDLSYNDRLGFRRAGAAMQGLVGSDLRVLRMTGIHSPYRAGSELLRENMDHIQNLEIVEWDLDSNGLEFIDYSAFGMFPKTLRYINLRQNRLHFGIYLEFLFDQRNPNILTFDAGNQEVAVRSELRYERLLARRRKSRSVTPRETTSIKLETLICSGSRSDIHMLPFTGVNNNVTFVDLSNNFIPEISGYTFRGLSKLQHLNLSGNYIEFCSDFAFAGLPSLLTFDLQNNLLGHSLAEDTNGMIFSELTSLEYLDISRNRINVLTVFLFRNLKRLKYLSLSDNYIDKITFDISNLSSLEYLDLSNNRLQQIQEYAHATLDTLALRNNLTVDLSRNMLLCNCETIPFLTWLTNTDVNLLNRDEYQCSFNNGTTQFLNETSVLLERLEEECASLVPLIAGVTALGTFLSALIVSFLTYRNRWRLRYMYYMAKLKLDIKPRKAADAQVFQYDIFVSYADENRGFVVNDMRMKLEDEMGLRINIRDRDFEIGEVNAINISKAIRMSKKTVLLLAKPFLRNKWCDFEMNMARMETIHMKRDVLVLVFLEQIPANQMSLGILDLLRSSPNIDYPGEEAMKPVFWTDLADKVREG